MADNLDSPDCCATHAMSIREHAVFAAMAGLLSHYGLDRDSSEEMPNYDVFAEHAVRQADAVLRELGYKLPEGGGQ